MLHQFLHDPARYVAPPPPSPATGATVETATFLPHLVACSAVRRLTHHMQDVHVSHQFKLWNGAYRFPFRNRREWTPHEREQYELHVQREADAGRGPAVGVEELKALQDARQYDERRVAAATVAALLAASQYWASY